MMTTEERAAYLAHLQAIAEQTRQQEIARLLEYVKAGEMTLREAANMSDTWVIMEASEVHNK